MKISSGLTPEIDKFRSWINLELNSILDREYAGDLEIIPECRLVFERIIRNSSTGEPYYVFSTTALFISGRLGI